MTVGVALPVTFTSTPPVAEQRAAVRRLESAGYGTTWVNEVIGKDALTQLAVLLAATDRMAFGTCVANIWTRSPQTTHGAAAYLAQAYPGRFTLGLGVGYPQQAASVGRDFGNPLATMRDYVTSMETDVQSPPVAGEYRRILAANGPNMLALAAEAADGALPAGQPVEHTTRARHILGPDKLLVVAQPVVVDDDRDRARDTARQVVAAWTARSSFRATLAEFGYDLDDDKLVDALVAYAGPDDIATKVRAHLAAGANHVTLLLPIGTEFTTGIDQFVRIAPAVADLG